MGLKGGCNSLFDDSGQKHRHRAEGDITAEEHELQAKLEDHFQ
jgi:hypothetical protein